LITSQKSFLTIPELLFEHFTELSVSEDRKSFRIFNALTSEYSKEEIRTIIEDPTLRSIRCSSNERAVDIMLLRALGLRKKFKAPTVLVVESEQKASKILAVLDEQLANARVANMFTQIKRKKNYTQYGSPDFIICTYHKLFKLLSQNVMVKVSGIIFLASITRSNYHSRSSLLDQILNLLPNRSNYTFILGEELRLRKEDLEWLFKGTAIIYKSEEYSRRDLLKDFRMNIFEDRNPVIAAVRNPDSPSARGASFLLKLILSATFHSRKTLKELKAALKRSISYKFYYSFEQPLKAPEEITRYSIDYQLQLILRYLTTRCRIKLVEFDEKYRYKMTEEGRKFFHRFCLSDGLALSLFNVLHALSQKLANGFLSQKDLEELMNDFTNLDIIWDVFYLDDNSSDHEVKKALNNSYSFKSAHDIFEGLDEDFGLLAEDAKKNLAAQKNILKEQRVTKKNPTANETYEQSKENEEEDESEVIKDFWGSKTTKIYSEEFLEKFIREYVSRKNVIVRELATEKGISAYYVRKILERLERMGVCEKVTRKGVNRYEVIYGTEENIKAALYLTKTCANCYSHKNGTRQCITNCILFENAYSTLTLEQVERATNPLRKGTRGCEGFQDAFESKDFTLDYSDFGTYTRESIKFLSNEQTMIQDQIKHNCLTCFKEIKSFGSKEEPFFTSKTITCSNCNSKYVHLSEQGKVRCISDNRNVIRAVVYSDLAYIPDVLKQKEERIPLTVDDDDTLELYVVEGKDNNPNDNKLDSCFLLFKDRRFALLEIERIYFTGEKHQEIEDELKRIGFKRIYRKKASNEISKEEINNLENSDTNSVDSITRSKYQHVIELLRTEGVTVNPSLISKINSAITFILAFKTSLSEGKKNTKGLFNKELGECLKILMRAKDDVSDPEAARILEGQALNQAFEILKQVGRKTGIRSWGRVVSRLVTWLVFAVFTRTCAYSKLDSMLNHLFKLVLTELKDVHKKTGVDVDLGTGLLHYRKSKSDIDRIGLFLDLVDFVRLIVIFVLTEAISNGEITSKDCRQFLGRGSVPLYDIKFSSLKKFEVLAERVLGFEIIYNDQEVPLKEAYEDYLKSFKLFLDHLTERFDVGDLEQLSRTELIEIVTECMQKASCQPISFRIKDFESKLKAIDLCSDEWKFLYEGFEDRFLSRKQTREEFRIEGMNDLFGKEDMIKDIEYNSTQDKYKVSLTKYQKRERRWIFYVLLVFAVKYLERRKLARFTINDFMTFFRLKYKRTRLLLQKMLEKNFVYRIISLNGTYLYFLNIKEKTVKLLINFLNDNLTNKEINPYKQIAAIQKSKLLHRAIKQYLSDFLEESPVLGIEHKSPAFEEFAKDIQAQLNNEVG